MKLYIPEQTPAGKDDFPNHPKKVKKWLNGLKQANMGDYTRHVYNGVMQLNRQAMPAKYRLENMEMLREACRYIFTQLYKHFINRTLPLPEKSLKIVNLNQAILSEMAVGYKIIIFEAANDLNKVDTKALMIASERALHYLFELILRWSQVYTEFPKGTWWDIHHIYAYAEHKKIHQKAVKDPEFPQKPVTVEELYKRILLFSLSRPNSLRQSDAERVYRAIPEWTCYTILGPKPPKDKLNRYYCAKLDSDSPPNCVSEDDLQDITNVRFMNNSELVNHLQQLIDDDDAFNKSATIGDQLSQETLRTLISSWNLCTKRRFSRAQSDSTIKVAIGLTPIHKALQLKVTPQKPQARSKRPTSIFSLESVPDNARANRDVFARDDPTFFITHPNMKAEPEKSASAWDMVAKGRAMTDSYARELAAQDSDMGEINKEEPDLHWKISNVSAGGYCLRWDSRSTSRAQVGELIGVCEREPDQTYQWRIGVIRWMQYTRENGLEIGVQILSPKAISCAVQRKERKNEKPFDCLMLPEINPIQQPATLLLPAYAFRRGNKLNVNVYDQEREIQLGTVREHTGSFTQFQFSHLNDDDTSEGNNKKKNSSGADDFDSIWSSL